MKNGILPRQNNISIRQSFNFGETCFEKCIYRKNSPTHIVFTCTDAIFELEAWVACSTSCWIIVAGGAMRVFALPHAQSLVGHHVARQTFSTDSLLFIRPMSAPFVFAVWMSIRRTYTKNRYPVHTEEILRVVNKRESPNLFHNKPYVKTSKMRNFA